MSQEKISPHITEWLRRRGLTVRSERGSQRVVVHLPGAEPIMVGWVDQSRIASGWWQGKWRRPHVHISGDSVDPLGENIDVALLEVIRYAWFGDILVARERQSGTPITHYTATLDDVGARQLASFEDKDLGKKDIEDVGNGTVKFTNLAVAYYRGLSRLTWHVDHNNRLCDGSDGSYPLIPDQ